MGIMLDAAVVIADEKGQFDLQNWAREKGEERFEMAAVTVAELWHGVERATEERKEKRQRYLEGLLAAVEVVPYTEQTAFEHARIWAGLEKAGKMIGYYDLIVAATALERGSKVATFNRRHFEVVPGLEVIEPG